eukprot:m.248800 g.248800  ORF g.248800 m.248800 type:complete len:612 (-) comp19080_c2_seq17:153-1988(-)
MGCGTSKLPSTGDGTGRRHSSFAHWLGHMLEDDIVKAWHGMGHEGRVLVDDITGIADKFDQLVRKAFGLQGFPSKFHEPPPPCTDIHIPGYDGKLYNDPYSLYRAADDFGHALHSYPALVARPEGSLESCAKDIAAIVQFAYEHNYHIAARGASIFDEIKVAHSTWGQSQVEGGIIIETSQINTVQFNDNGTVTIGGGAIWDDVVQKCKARTPPVTIPITTTNLFLTVGGTLSVLCAEYASTTLGPAVDHIVELTVVTATGQGDASIVKCSAAENEDLFNAVRCGLGEYGLIVSVTFNISTELPKVNVYNMAYLDHDDAIQAMDYLNTKNLKVTGTLIEVLTHFEVEIAVGDLQIPIGIPPWMQMLVRLPRLLDVINPRLKAKGIDFIYYFTAVNYEYEGQEPLTRKGVHEGIPHPVDTWERHVDFYTYKVSLDPFLTLDMKFGSWNFPHTQLSVFVPRSKLEPLLKEALDHYRPVGKNPQHTKTVLYFAVCPYRHDFVKAPGFMLPPTSEPDEQYVLLSTMGSVRDHPEAGSEPVEQHFAEQLSAMRVIAHDIMLKHCPEAKTFPWGYIPYSWKDHYGEHFERQKKYKDQFDPKGILGGAGVFTQNDLVR